MMLPDLQTQGGGSEVHNFNNLPLRICLNLKLTQISRFFLFGFVLFCFYQVLNRSGDLVSSKFLEVGYYTRLS